MQCRAGERVLETFGYLSFDFNEVKWALVPSEQLQTERKACKLGKTAENPGWLVARSGKHRDYAKHARSRGSHGHDTSEPHAYAYLITSNIHDFCA